MNAVPKGVMLDTRWPYAARPLPRMGIIVIENDPVPEMELWRLVPSLASVHTVRFQLPRRDGEIYRGVGMARLYRETELDRALGMLRRLQVDGICLCYSHGVGFGDDGFDAAFIEEGRRRTGCGMVTTATRALFALLQRRQVRAPLVLFPPWYTDAAAQVSLARFFEHGLDAKHGVTFALPESWGPGEVAARRDGGSVWEVQAAAVYSQIEQALMQSNGRPDAIVIPDCGFPSLDAIKRVEGELDLPVVSANLACLDWFLEATSLGDPTNG